MLEEVEHRNVAFDVYQHLYGGYPYRARMCWFSQHHMFKFFSDAEKIMSAVDIPRYGERCRIRLKHQLMSRVVTTPMRAQSLMPWYTPHSYRIPANVEALSAHFTQLAQHVR